MPKPRKKVVARSSVAIEETLISVDEAVRLCGNSKSWFNETILYAGLIERDENGKIRLGDLTPSVISNFKSEKRKKVTLEDLKVAKASNVLMATDDSYAKATELASMLRSELEGVPGQSTRDLELRKAIETNIGSAFKRFIARAEEAFAST